MSDSPTRFSLRTVTGNPGSYPSAQPARVEEAVSMQAAPAALSGSISDLGLRDPTVETLPPFRLEGSGEWGGGPSPISMPSLPALRAVEPGPATGGIGISWHSLEEVPFAAPSVSTPTTEPVSAPLPVAGAAAEAPPRPATEAALATSARPSASASRSPEKKPDQRGHRWDVVVGTLVVLLVGYLLLAGGLYAFRLWQARQSNSVVLVQDIGHGGDSQIMVTFTPDDWLQVTEIDHDDPTRVTVLAVTQVIALANTKVVLEAWLQAVLQPGRLDLVMQLDGGLDWPPYRPQFTTILINNVAAVKKDPHAPGFRTPTPTELQQALRKLST